MSYYILLDTNIIIKNIYWGKTKEDVVNQAREQIDKYPEYRELNNDEIIELLDDDYFEFELAIREGDCPHPKTPKKVIEFIYSSYADVPAKHIEDYTSLIPIMEVKLAAGAGSVVSENVKGQMLFMNDWLSSKDVKKENACLFEIKGDSMEPLFSEGEYVLVDKGYSKSIEYLSVIAVTNEDNLMLIKYLDQNDVGQWVLRSENEQYADIPFNDDCTIIGEVVWATGLGEE